MLRSGKFKLLKHLFGLLELRPGETLTIEKEAYNGNA